MSQNQKYKLVWEWIRFLKVDKYHINGLAKKAILKKVILRLLGSCTISKQESCHLILETSMAFCSNQFYKIN